MSFEDPLNSVPTEEGPQIPHNLEDLDDKALRALVVENLKKWGPEKEEVRHVLVQWTSRQERMVENAEGQTRFEMDRARLYFEAGFYDDAVESLMGAQILAEHEGLPELLREIETMYEEFNS